MIILKKITINLFLNISKWLLGLNLIIKFLRVEKVLNIVDSVAWKSVNTIFKKNDKNQYLANYFFKLLKLKKI